MHMRRGVLMGVLCAAFLAASGTSCRADGYDGVRPPCVAGQWYKATGKGLRAQVEELLGAAVDEHVSGRVVALVAPHAGYVFSGRAAASAYRTIQGKPYRRVIILGACHNPHFRGAEFSAEPFRGASIPKYTHYRTPLGQVPVARDVCDALAKEPLFAFHVGAHVREHSIESQLPFLQVALEDFELVPVLIGDMEPGDYARVADALRTYVDDETLLVVSTDFTHYGRNYGYTPFPPDKLVSAKIKALDSGAISHLYDADTNGFLEYVRETGITICGYRSLAVMLELLPKDCSGRLVSYYRSADITKDFSSSVSYVGMYFSEEATVSEDSMLNTEEQRLLLKLARETIEHYVRTQQIAPVEEETLTPRLKKKCGVFVTLRKKGELRGCIGYVEGIAPLWRAVQDNAVSAATRDPRFEPVTPRELQDISIELSVMSPLERISSADEVVVGRHGLVIEKGLNRGLLLPQVATEQGWDRETFLKGVCRKAWLADDAWKKGARLWVFTAQVFSEGEHEES